MLPTKSGQTWRPVTTTTPPPPRPPSRGLASQLLLAQDPVPPPPAQASRRVAGTTPSVPRTTRGAPEPARESLGGSGAWVEKEQGPRASAGAEIWLEARPRP